MNKIVLGSSLVAAGAACAASPALAEANSTDSDTALARVQVNTTIALTMVDNDFLLEGVEGDTPQQDAAVKYNVRTNNQAGYTVTVKAQDSLLRASAPNADTIDVSALKVRENAAGEGAIDAFQSMSASEARTLHTQDHRSSGYRLEASGDNLADDYKLQIPFVNSDQYRVTLDYVATAN